MPKPTTLQELFKTANKDLPVNLGFAVNMVDGKPVHFVDGDYSALQTDAPGIGIKTMPVGILKSIETVGNEILDLAKNAGVNIKDLKEFKHADLNTDGKIDAQEVGALVIAASMQHGAAVSRKNNQEQAWSVPDSKLSKEDLAKLSDPAKAELIHNVARQLLGDNGLLNLSATRSDVSNLSLKTAIIKSGRLPS